MLIYPAMSFIFATMTLTKLLFSPLTEWRRTRGEVFKEVFFFCAIATVYFIWAYCNMHYFPQAPVPVQYHVDRPNFMPDEIIARLAILGNVFNKLIWGEAVIRGWLIIIPLLAGIISGIVYFIKSDFYINNKKLATSVMLQMIVGTIALAILSSSFYLLIPNRDHGSRLLLGVIAAGNILTFWGVIRCSEILPRQLKFIFSLIILSTLFLMSAADANIRTTMSALASSSYMQFVKNKISDHYADNQKLQRIHFIIAKSDYPYDEFFITNKALEQLLGRNQYKLQWCSLPRGAEGSEQDHQEDAIACMKQLPANGIAITYTHPNETFTRTNDMLIVDKQNVSVAKYKKSFENLVDVVVV
jgi:phosphate/sulfate permease